MIIISLGKKLLSYILQTHHELTHERTHQGSKLGWSCGPSLLPKLLSDHQIPSAMSCGGQVVYWKLLTIILTTF